MDAPEPNRRSRERIVAEIPALLTSDDGREWWGTCINYSREGALVKLPTAWTNDKQVRFTLDPRLSQAEAPVLSQVVRSTLTEGNATFLALRFQPSP